MKPVPICRGFPSELQLQGHQVSFVPDIQPGLKNGAVLAYATQQQALLITADKTDFGELIFQQRKPSLGLIVVRLPGKMPQQRKVAMILRAIATYGLQLLGKVAVISEQEIKIRQLPPPEQAK